MEKFLSTLFIAGLLAGSLTPVHAVDSDYQKAFNEAQEYISSATINWDDAVIKNEELLYDIDLNPFGYVFNVENGANDGYIIVIKDTNGSYFVNEASPDSSSPYISDQSDINVYYSALNYYSVDGAVGTDLGSEVHYTDLRTEDEFVREDFIEPRGFTTDNNAKTARASVTVMLRLWYNNYEYAEQSSGSDPICVPCSIAMALIYMHNTGVISLLETDVDTVRDLLIERMPDSGGVVNGPTARAGLHDFCDDYCAEDISLSYSVSGGTTSSWNNATAEIDDNMPVLIVYQPGVFEYNDTLAHANTMCGYRATSSGNYSISQDPLNNKTVEVEWDSSNIAEHYTFGVYQ